MRNVIVIALLAALLPAAAAEAADCGPLKIVDRIQMVPLYGDNRDVLPVLVNGQQQKFLFDTGGERTQITRTAATALNLPIKQGNMEMLDVTGKVSRDAATAQTFQLGRMLGKDVGLPVNPGLEGKPFDGIVALEVLRTSDIDVDFGTDTMSLFSTDHCDGQVVYWKARAVAVVPIVWHGYHMSVPVTMDGHELRADIDTGAATTALLMDTAKGFYNLTMGNTDTPEAGNLNGDASLKIYRHTFKSLSFGSITVNNPRPYIIPRAMGRDLSKVGIGGSRVRTERDEIDQPDLIIGMDVLRKLHIYIAMKENKMYITDASAAAAATPAAASADQVKAAYKKSAEADMDAMNKRLSSNPGDAAALGGLCFYKATLKEDLDAALGDCDQAIKLTPNNANYLISRALVLYQQGKYQDALEAYNAALAINPKSAAALRLRGATKGKLGDSAGRDADIAAAKVVNGNIEATFKPLDVEL